MERGRGASWRRSPGRASTASAPPWAAALVYLADASTALGDEAMAAIVYPELEALPGATVMVGHMVATYGAPDRYLGMLAATLGEAELAGTFRAGDGADQRIGASTSVAHTAYEHGRSSSAGAAGPAGGPRSCSGRRRSSPSGSG